jgi:hypothetical protein
MKTFKLILILLICFISINESAVSSEAVIKVSADGGTNWTKYKTIEEFSTNFLITSNSKGTNIILNNKIYYFPSYYEAVHNLQIVNEFVFSGSLQKQIKPIIFTDALLYSVYPNPFVNTLSIKFSIGGNYKITLTDELQKLILTRNIFVIEGESVTLNIENECNYSKLCNLVIYQNNQLVYTKKVIKSLN